MDISVVGTHRYNGDRVLQYLEVDAEAAQAVLTAANELTTIASASVIVDGKSSRLQCLTAEPVPELTLVHHGAVLGPTRLTADRVTLTFPIPSQLRRSELLNALAETCSEPTGISCVSDDKPGGVTDVSGIYRQAGLTEEQMVALQAAYHHDYFDRLRWKRPKSRKRSVSSI